MRNRDQCKREEHYDSNGDQRVQAEWVNRDKGKREDKTY